MVVAAMESVGKWLAEQAFAGRVFSVLFRFGTGVFLLVSAALCIRMFTGLPVVASFVLWLILTSPVQLSARPARGILGPAWRDALNSALLMLGTAYRVAGHASDLTVLVIVAYWSLVLLARKR